MEKENTMCDDPPRLCPERMTPEQAIGVIVAVKRIAELPHTSHTTIGGAFRIRLIELVVRDAAACQSAK